MTQEEIDLLNLTADVYNAWAKLPRYHPEENVEFVHHLHQLQTMVMSRMAIRAHPIIFNWQQ